MGTEKSTSTDAEGSSTRLFKLNSLGVGSIAICLLFVVAFIGFQPDKLSLSDRYFPSPTATFTRTPSLTPTRTLTPTPSLTPTMTFTPTMSPTAYSYISPQEGAPVYTDNFETDTMSWNAYYENNSVSVKDSKLVLRSNQIGSQGLALCFGCTIYNNEFYFQAELLPERSTPIHYGIAYCVSDEDEEYYVFLINSTYAFYTLYKYPNEQNYLVLPKFSDLINSYPASNTLGVKYDDGTMGLYINGVLVESLNDEDPLPCKQPGIFVSNGILNLFADNIFAYNIISVAP